MPCDLLGCTTETSIVYFDIHAICALILIQQSHQRGQIHCLVWLRMSDRDSTNSPRTSSVSLLVLVYSCVCFIRLPGTHVRVVCVCACVSLPRTKSKKVRTRSAFPFLRAEPAARVSEKNDNQCAWFCRCGLDILGELILRNKSRAGGRQVDTQAG